MTTPQPLPHDPTAMQFQLRDYQEAGVNFACDFFDNASPGSRAVLASPCGTGKSVVEVATRRKRGPGCWLVTPRLEIARGILEKDGRPVDSAADLVRACWERRIVTPIRFRNALEQGRIPEVSELILDEGHHAQSRSWREIQSLCGEPPAILLTATPYRGTSAGTAKFLAEWGEPTWMVPLREAARRGDVSIPQCSVLPLVDDDVVELTAAGEFSVQSVASAYGSRLEDLAERSLHWWDHVTGEWDRPTVYAFPSTATSRDFAAALLRRGVPAVCISAASSRAERDAAYTLLLARLACLCQVAVLSEGVDLPVRRLVDASPRMSPVAWMQSLGRCMRPVARGEEPADYICTNRNLGRFSYLLEGLLPPSVVAAAEQAFGGPGKRGGHRAVGLEAVGRFKAAEVKLLDGCTALFYALVDARGGRMREFACTVHPAWPDPIWGERIHGSKPDGTRDWGRWVRCEPPSDLKGFGSQPQRDPTDKMLAFWRRSAEGRGIDPTQSVNRKGFTLLPFALDLGLRFRS